MKSRTVYLLSAVLAFCQEWVSFMVSYRTQLAEFTSIMHNSLILMINQYELDPNSYCLATPIVKNSLYCRNTCT